MKALYLIEIERADDVVFIPMTDVLEAQTLVEILKEQKIVANVHPSKLFDTCEQVMENLKINVPDIPEPNPN